MAMIPPTHSKSRGGESQTMLDVRRWRKEAYEARQRMTPQEREMDDRATEELARKLGLRVVKAEDVNK